MARGSQQAQTAGTSAQELSNKLQGNQAATYASLFPELQAEITNPPGMTPQTQAQMLTQAQQGAGGTEAATVGQGALLAGRTKNPGTAAAAIGQGARGAGEQLSKNALGIQLANQQLRERQRQAGLTGMQGLNATELGGGINALGIVPQAVNANTNAINASYDWAKDIMAPMVQAAGQAATGQL